MNYGSQEQIDTYIPRMVSGEFIGCIAMSEPAAGRYFLYVLNKLYEI